MLGHTPSPARILAQRVSLQNLCSTITQTPKEANSSARPVWLLHTGLLFRIPPHIYSPKTKRKPWSLEAVLTLIQSEEQDVEAQAGQQGTQRRLPPTTQRVLVTKVHSVAPPSGKGEGASTGETLKPGARGGGLELRMSRRNENWVSHLGRCLGEELKSHTRSCDEKRYPLRTRTPVALSPRSRKHS